MTREEHLSWCKERANEYLDQGDITNAIASMLSDLGKHEETKGVGSSMAMIGLMAASSDNMDEAKRFINGFR